MRILKYCWKSFEKNILEFNLNQLIISLKFRIYTEKIWIFDSKEILPLFFLDIFYRC